MTLYRYAALLCAGLFAFSCSEDLGSVADQSSTTTGTGGSLARFTIKGDFLYTVDAENLRVFDIHDPNESKYMASYQVGFGVETIFPLENFLYLGTRSGMLIYQVDSTGIPYFIGAFDHIVSCDPVVSDGQYAYVTLRVSGCREAAFGAANTLDVIDVNDPTAPYLVASYDMSGPYGLGLDGNILFVCEGERGLKVFDVSDPLNIILLQEINTLNAIDVIPLDGLLLVIGPNAIVEFDYSDINQIKKLSEIAIGE